MAAVSMGVSLQLASNQKGLQLHDFISGKKNNEVR
jgi:hypothetical protein